MQRIAFLAAAAALALSQSAPAHADGGFIVANTDRSVAIQKVYFANAGESDPWVLSSMDGPVAPGTDATFVMTTGNCWFDVKVEFSDGYAQTFNTVNICQGRRLIAT